MNSAERLLSIYDKLVAIQPDRAMLQTWADVFGLDTAGEHLEDEVTACVVALRGQIDFAKARLSANEVPTHLTSPGFERFKHVASPAQLNVSWHQLRGNIQPPECRQSFAWGSWVLRSESENEMPTEEMADLLSKLNELEESLGEAEMSPYLRDFIQRQVDTIRSALRVYDVQGVRPLQEVMRKVAGDFRIEEAHFLRELEDAPDEAKGILAKAIEVIEKTAKTCDSLDKIKKFGEGAYEVSCKFGPKLLPYINKAIESLVA